MTLVRGTEGVETITNLKKREVRLGKFERDVESGRRLGRRKFRGERERERERFRT